MNKIAFEELYMQQLPGLFRLAQSILRQPSDAEDAVQQAVLQAWRQIETIQHGIALPSYGAMDNWGGAKAITVEW